MKKKMMKNEPIYEKSNWISDFILLVIISSLGIFALILLDSNIFIKISEIILIGTFVYLFSKDSLHKIEIFEHGITISYYIKPKISNNKLIPNANILEVKYYAYKLNSPAHLRIFYRKAKNGKSSFRFAISEEKKLKEIITMYNAMGIKITDYPKGCLQEINIFNTSNGNT